MRSSTTPIKVYKTWCCATSHLMCNKMQPAYVWIPHPDFFWIYATTLVQFVFFWSHDICFKSGHPLADSESTTKTVIDWCVTTIVDRDGLSFCTRVLQSQSEVSKCLGFMYSDKKHNWLIVEIWDPEVAFWLGFLGWTIDCPYFSPREEKRIPFMWSWCHLLLPGHLFKKDASVILHFQKESLQMPPTFPQIWKDVYCANRFVFHIQQSLLVWSAQK